MNKSPNPHKQLASLYDFGVDELVSDTPLNRFAAQLPSTSVILPVGGSIAQQARLLAEQATTLAELKQVVCDFEGCSLKKTATNTVFSDGNPSSGIMVIGEAPGANEDAQGIPFCGDSGQLLDNMLATIGLDRTKFYITNAIFWRPPGNRKPSDEEVEICQAFGEKHIAMVAPKVLILVGATAAQSYLNSEATMTTLRQSTHYYENRYLSAKIPCFVMYHPSYLLRQPGQKKQAWHDLQKINLFLQQSKL